VRSGDAAADRLKRAETLLKLRPNADEGRLAVAPAAIDAREFARAREALTPVLTARPTQNALILTAELEESETGDRGRAREWLARAVGAPRDPAWMADGVILEKWAPASPVTGRIDAVEWKAPAMALEAPRLHIDARELEPPAEAPVPVEAPDEVAAPARTPIAVAAPAAPPPAAAGGKRTNGGGAAHGWQAAQPAEAREPPQPAEPAMRPLIPDDPGVGEDEEETESRRRRGF
jgi:HemY protein